MAGAAGRASRTFTDESRSGASAAGSVAKATGWPNVGAGSAASATAAPLLLGGPATGRGVGGRTAVDGGAGLPATTGEAAGAAPPVPVAGGSGAAPTGAFGSVTVRARGAAGAAAPADAPSTSTPEGVMRRVAAHFRHFIRSGRAPNRSSAIWYFDWQLGQENFIRVVADGAMCGGGYLAERRDATPYRSATRSSHRVHEKLTGAGECALGSTVGWARRARAAARAPTSPRLCCESPPSDTAPPGS